MKCRWLVPLLLACSSCASFSGPALQPEINNLVVADQVKLAADKIEAASADYGHGNYLLYYLDRGMVEYYAGLYSQSIVSFEKAKKRFDELYTQSLSSEAASWVGNDYSLPYRGTDHEYVLINVFQALNYLALGNVNEALVEARDMDSKYQVIDKAAAAAKRSRFEDNGFARMFMGFVNEATGRSDDRDNARLFYQQAEQVYAQYYGGQYEPAVLKERARALESGSSDADKAVVYVFQLAGFAPQKVQQSLPVPAGEGMIAQVAFPEYVKRYYAIHQGVLMVEGPNGYNRSVPTELGVSIEELAIKDLESRKALLLTKGILRPVVKVMLEQREKELVKKKFGEPAAGLFGLVGSLYNVVSERADLRSWQALPAQIRVARLTLEPGHYHLRFDHQAEGGVLVENVDLGGQDFLRGGTYFFVTRGRR
ncbi:MAG: hypothetical protein HQL22_04610 [Candidatus Omnitrophica bacterium]|nr:hypothetical protein [Candidatus Omnitrophota bacterium]